MIAESDELCYVCGTVLDYDTWNIKKQRLQETEQDILFREGEVWWCHIGVNLGYELYGKGEHFWRPVFILKKHNRLTFLGLPLGSTVKPHAFYLPFPFRGRNGCIRLDQARILSSKRLSNRMGKVTSLQLQAIKQAYVGIILGA
jgi:mRNA interferase MazF